MSRNRGFTLIEILIYIGIVSGVLIAATTFAWNVIDSKTKAQAYQAADANALVVLEKLSQTIRSAQDIDPSSAFGINLADPGSAGQHLRLVMQDSLQNPTTIDVTDGVVQVAAGGGPALSLSSNLVNVTTLTFTNASSANGKSMNIGIELTVNYDNPENRPERNASSVVRTSVELLNRPW